MFIQELRDSMAEEMKLVEKYLENYMREEKGMEPLNRIMRSVMDTRGKRMRPMVVLLSGTFGPGYPDCRDRLCKLGAMIEMTHIASLIHDDIIDDSPVRRGKPTVQSVFGKDMAVYTGDFILSRMMCHLLEDGFVEPGRILARCVGHMCSGELLQYQNQFNENASEEDYFAAVRGKTAAIFQAAARTGALEAGCGLELQELLGELAENLGIIFQLRDDLNDFLSDEKKEGKPVHNDFKTGVYTLPVLYTLRLQETGPRLKSVVRDICSGGDPEKGACVMEELVRESGGIEYARKKMSEYRERAEALLARLPGHGGNGALRGIFEYLAG